ncbi:Tn7 transposase TnsA N-terminal domain-containing protein [Rhizobium leguminosarum]
MTYAEAAGRTDVMWLRPSASTGSRQPTPRTKGSVRVWVYDPGTNRELGCESMLEFRFALMLMADPEVVCIEDQPKARKYLVPGESKRRKHTFDFLVTYRSGKKIAFAVKPAEQVEEEGIELIVDLITVQSLAGFADEAFVVTDELILPELAENAEDIVEARKSRNAADCRAVLEFMQQHFEPISMHDVCNAFQDRGWARCALLNLIYDGLVEHLNPTQTFDEAPLVRTVFN